MCFNTGKLIVLKYPYPREVEENPDYHSSVIAHFLSDPPKEPRKPPARRTQSDSEILSDCAPHEESNLCSSVEETPNHKETPSIHNVSVSRTTSGGYYSSKKLRCVSDINGV